MFLKHIKQSIFLKKVRFLKNVSKEMFGYNPILVKNHSKSKIQNATHKMKNIPRSLRVVGSLASRQGSIVAIRKNFWGLF